MTILFNLNFFCLFFKIFFKNALFVRSSQALVYEANLTVLNKLLPLVVVFFSSFLFFSYQYFWFRAVHATSSATKYLFYGWKTTYSTLFSYKPFAVLVKYDFGYYIRLFYEFFSLAWYFNFVINYFCLRVFLFCRFFYELLDRGLAEFFFGATRVFKLSFYLTRFSGLVNGGYVLIYLLVPVIFLIFFFIF